MAATPAAPEPETIYGAAPASPEPMQAPAGPSAAPGQPTAPTPGPMPAPLPPPPKKKTWLIAVVAVVVVVVVVVGALAASGILNPKSSSGPNIIGPAISYSSSAPSGTSTVGNTSGGPWTWIGAEGWNISTSESNPSYNSLGNGAGCTWSAVAGAPSTIVFAATPSNATPGTAATWVYVAVNGAGNVLFVIDALGTTYAAVEGSTGCGASFSGTANLSGIHVVDSTKVAASADSNGGSAWLCAHSGATEAFILVGVAEDGTTVAGWDVEYTTCSFGSASGSGDVYSALFDASSGALLETPQTATGEPCSDV
jgi:hypothetical protein